jgi:hypothetical protein
MSIMDFGFGITATESSYGTVRGQLEILNNPNNVSQDEIIEWVGMRSWDLQETVNNGENEMELELDKEVVIRFIWDEEEIDWESNGNGMEDWNICGCGQGY